MLNNKVTRYIALGSSIGTSLVAPVLLGIFGGQFLDRKLGTGQWLSLAGVLIGLTVGVLSIVQIIRSIERSEKS